MMPAMLHRLSGMSQILMVLFEQVGIHGESAQYLGHQNSKAQPLENPGQLLS